jgi:DNA excision repair protein ERCC-3
LLLLSSESHDPDLLVLDGIPTAAKKSIESEDQGALEDEYGAKDFRSQMVLKSDHESRPLWVVSCCEFFFAFCNVLMNLHEES